MGELHRHPDGFIYVRDGAKTYVATPEDFERDYSITLLMLPEGANEQIYTQGRRHAFMGGGNVIDGGPMPWPDGDTVIANIDLGINNMHQRESERLEQQRKEAEAAQTQADAEKRATDKAISEALARLEKEVAALKAHVGLVN